MQLVSASPRRRWINRTFQWETSKSSTVIQRWCLLTLTGIYFVKIVFLLHFDGGRHCLSTVYTYCTLSSTVCCNSEHWRELWATTYSSSSTQHPSLHRWEKSCCCCLSSDQTKLRTWSNRFETNKKSENVVTIVIWQVTVVYYWLRACNTEVL